MQLHETRSLSNALTVVSFSLLPSLPPPLSLYQMVNLTQKKTLENNPRHPLVKELQCRVEKDESDETTVDLVRVMLDTAILRSGYTLPDSSSFAGRIERMLKLRECRRGF